jgi:hypothetical protein
MTQAQRDAIASPVQGLCVTNSDTTKLNLHNGTAWVDVGSGSSGGINYISPNHDAESSTAGWSTYADAAGALPVDCTGGSPTVTWAQTAVTPLRDLKSFLFTSPASSVQGQGVAFPFTIAIADEAKPLTISFEYMAASGTWQPGSDTVDSDIEPYIYDVTNGVVIQPAGYKLTGGSVGQFKYQGSFQTASNSVSYRLCLHRATTNAVAFGMDFDTVSVGPEPKVMGSPISDWTAFTPTGSWTTNVTYTGYWRRVGDTMQVTAKATMNGLPAPAVGFGINLPSGYSIDTAKLVTATLSQRDAFIGSLHVLDNAVADYYGVVVGDTATNVLPRFTKTDNAANNGYVTIDTATPFAFNTNDAISVYYEVPILGWGSTVTLSKDTDTRVVAASYKLAANNTPGIGNPFDFATKIFDTHSAVTTGAAWKYTVPVPGFYVVDVHYLLTAAVAGTMYVYKNSVLQTALTTVNTANETSGRAIVQCNAGDFLDIRADANATVDSSSGSRYSNISINRLSGPDTIAASELVQARASTTAGQSIATSTVTIIDFGTKTFDTHGAITTGGAWKFTAPSPGKYSVTAALKLIASPGWQTAEIFTVSVYKNGVLYSTMGKLTTITNNSVENAIAGTDDVEMNAGDFIDIRAFQTNGNAITLATTAGDNFVSIKRNGGL